MFFLKKNLFVVLHAEYFALFFGLKWRRIRPKRSLHFTSTSLSASTYVRPVHSALDPSVHSTHDPSVFSSHDPSVFSSHDRAVFSTHDPSMLSSHNRSVLSSHDRAVHSAKFLCLYC